MDSAEELQSYIHKLSMSVEQQRLMKAEVCECRHFCLCFWPCDLIVLSLIYLNYWIKIIKHDRIDSFQSRDRLEDSEGKTSIELLHKRVNFSSVTQPQIFLSPLKRIKHRYF